MITIYKILKIYGIDPATVKLVRHGNKEIPIYETFLNNTENSNFTGKIRSLLKEHNLPDEWFNRVISMI